MKSTKKNVAQKFSEEYPELRFLEGKFFETDHELYETNILNRELDMPRVNEVLMPSMGDYGFISLALILKTTAFLGKLACPLLDGHNRMDAAKKLNLPYHYLLVELKDDTVANIAKLMSKLNSSAKTWGDIDYINTFAKAGSREMAFLQKRVRANHLDEKGRKKKLLQITDLKSIHLTAKGKAEFKEGYPELRDVKDSLKLEEAIIRLAKPVINGITNPTAIKALNKSYTRRCLIPMMIENRKRISYEDFADALIKETQRMALAKEFWEEDEKTLGTQLTRFVDIYVGK